MGENGKEKERNKESRHKNESVNCVILKTHDFSYVLCRYGLQPHFNINKAIYHAVPTLCCIHSLRKSLIVSCHHRTPDH